MQLNIFPRAVSPSMPPRSHTLSNLTGKLGVLLIQALRLFARISRTIEQLYPLCCIFFFRRYGSMLVLWLVGRRCQGHRFWLQIIHGNFSGHDGVARQRNQPRLNTCGSVVISLGTKLILLRSLVMGSCPSAAPSPSAWAVKASQYVGRYWF